MPTRNVLEVIDGEYLSDGNKKEQIVTCRLIDKIQIKFQAQHVDFAITTRCLPHLNVLKKDNSQQCCFCEQRTNEQLNSFA